MDLEQNVLLIFRRYLPNKKKENFIDFKIKKTPSEIEIWEYFDTNSHFKIDYFCENSVFICKLTFLH